MIKIKHLKSGLVVLTFTLVSCVTQSHAVKLVETEGRIGLEDTRVTDRQADVMNRIADKFESQPDCSQVKTSLANSRKAYVMEVCNVALGDGEMQYGGVPVKAMNFRFIDARLLQMEMVFAETPGSADVVAQAVNDELALSDNESETNYRSWKSDKDLIELSSEQSSTTLKISDARLAGSVMALARN